jgi:cytochrome P450
MATQISLDQLTADPHTVLASLRGIGPAVWVEALRGWVVTSRDLALEVMRDDTTFTVDHPGFTTAQVVGPSMLSRDGSEHRRHLDPFASFFRMASLRAASPHASGTAPGNGLPQFGPMARRSCGRHWPDPSPSRWSPSY